MTTPEDPEDPEMRLGPIVSLEDVSHSRHQVVLRFGVDGLSTGEDVNRQWGKSFAAERLLSAYIREHRVADFTYFSLLKPIHDPLLQPS